MKHVLAALLAALFLAFSSGAVRALELSFEGAFTQGGLVIGRTRPGAAVALDGAPVPVGEDGLFLLGFGREAPSRAKLVVTAPDGAREERELTVDARRFDIQRIDGLPPAVVTPDPATLARIQADREAIRAARRRLTPEARFLTGFEWPVVGRVSGVFGSQRILNGEPRAPHNGVDVGAPEGTPVVAPADGVVALARDDMVLTGQTVLLDHGRGLTTVYAHLSRIEVVEGQSVRRGQPIGRVGATGRATGPHLHWGLNLGETPLDPALLLPPMPVSN